MKTLINKANPAIRITAPEITQTEIDGVKIYWVTGVHEVCGSLLLLDNWTLVEEDTLLQFRAKIKANQIIALDALKRAFVAGLLSKEDYDDGVSHINENTNDVLIDLPILNLVEEKPTCKDSLQDELTWEDIAKIDNLIFGMRDGVSGKVSYFEVLKLFKKYKQKNK